MIPLKADTLFNVTCRLSSAIKALKALNALRSNRGCRKANGERTEEMFGLLMDVGCEYDVSCLDSTSTVQTRPRTLRLWRMPVSPTQYCTDGLMVKSRGGHRQQDDAVVSLDIRLATLSRR